MSLQEEYRRQYRWRSWASVFAKLPRLEGQVVLDLGCAVGDLAADLSERGAQVIGLDSDSQSVRYANDRCIPAAQFRVVDLGRLREPDLRVDGIWSSFTAAYFPDFEATAASWVAHLRPGGWIALTEMDNLFGHEPIDDRTRQVLEDYVTSAMDSQRYDFRMGSRIAKICRQLGLRVCHDFEVPDRELSFSGRASDEVLQAWRDRFERMKVLKDFCGAEFERIRDSFLECLSREDHRCRASVRCCIATR